MLSAKGYRPWAPGQSFLLPPCPLDWLPDNHLVFFMLDVVRGLDISAIEQVVHEKDARGNRPFDPRMMVALILYGYCVGVASSRKLEKATSEDVAFRVLVGGCQPDHSAIAEFRRVHHVALGALFVQVLRLCQKAGLVKLGHAALDGTKVQANASKHKAMSYERMLKTEAQLKADVEAFLKNSEETDRQEDAKYGPDRRGDELPDELARRESRLKKIRQAKAELEAEAAETRARELREQAERAKAKAEAASDDGKSNAERAAQRAQQKARAATETATQKAEATPARPKETGADAMPEHHVPATTDGSPTPKAQRNFTDPESSIMKKGGDFLQGYNAQAVVDDAHQVILAHGVSNQPPDQEHLAPMLERVQDNCGALPQKLTADAGYFSDANAQRCRAKGVDAYLSVDRQSHGASSATPPHGTEERQRMRAKLATAEGRAIYARRKATVEPVFGQIKSARGLSRFLLRGVAKARSEWALMCTGHNLLKLYRCGIVAPVV